MVVGSIPTGGFFFVFFVVFVFFSFFFSFFSLSKLWLTEFQNCDISRKLLLSDTFKPPWPNGQGVGLLIRRLRVRVPQGVLSRRYTYDKGKYVDGAMSAVVRAVENTGTRDRTGDLQRVRLTS
jgi:hypothetical protein